MPFLAEPRFSETARPLKSARLSLVMSKKSYSIDMVMAF